METFTQTSNEPYDKHKYQLFFADGKSVILDTFEDLQRVWFSTPGCNLSHVEVLDKKAEKQTKGFK